MRVGPKDTARPGPRTAYETVFRVAIHLVTGWDDAREWDAPLAARQYGGRSRLLGEACAAWRSRTANPWPDSGVPAPRAQRLSDVVNHARVVILPRFPVANLGSHVLGCGGASARTGSRCMSIRFWPVNPAWTQRTFSVPFVPAVAWLSWGGSVRGRRPRRPPGRGGSRSAGPTARSGPLGGPVGPANRGRVARAPAGAADNGVARAAGCGRAHGGRPRDGVINPAQSGVAPRGAG